MRAQRSSLAPTACNLPSISSNLPPVRFVAARGSPTADLYVEYALSCMGESESGIQFENQLRFANHKYSYLYGTDWNQSLDNLTRIGNRTCMNPFDPRDARVARVYMRQLR